MPQIDPIPDSRMRFLTISEHNLIIAGNIACNVERVRCTATPTGVVGIMLDTDLLEMHKEQIVIEKEHDNILGESYFEPMNEKLARRRGIRTRPKEPDVPSVISGGNLVRRLWRT